MTHLIASRVDINSNPNSNSNFSKHWATLLSPSPSPELPSPKSINVGLSVTTSPASAGPRQGGISLPPLHTAVPLAKLDTYRRPKDTSVSPIQEMLFRKSPKAHYHHHHQNMPSPSPASGGERERERAQNVPRFCAPTPRPHQQTAGAGRPVLSRLTTDLYPTSSHSLKSPRKRADQGQLGVLNRAFARSPYPSTEERDRLSKRLGMTSRSVQIWFQNKRRSVKVQEESIQERYTGGTL